VVQLQPVKVTDIEVEYYEEGVEIVFAFLRSPKTGKPVIKPVRWSSYFGDGTHIPLPPWMLRDMKKQSAAILRDRARARQQAAH